MLNNQIDGYGEDEEKPLVFHHKNGEYRKSEPQHLQDIANGNLNVKRGFFKVLVSTRGNRALFFVLCLTFVLTFFFQIFGQKSNERNIGDLSCTLTAFSFEDKIYISLKFAPLKQEVSISEKNFQLTFSIYNSNSEKADEYKTDYIFPGKDDYVRTTFTDFDIEEVKCIVNYNDLETDGVMSNSELKNKECKLSVKVQKP